MRVVMVRHAESTANTAQVLSTGAPGPGLSARGRDQSLVLARRLAAQSVAGLYVSPLARARQTAQPLADRLGMEPVVLDGLREVEAGEAEGRLYGQIQEYARTAQAWGRGQLHLRIRGGPDGHEFVERFDTAMDTVVGRHHPGDSVVVVAHDVCLRVWLGLRAVGLTEEQLVRLGAEPLPNTAVVGVSWSGRGWRMDDVGQPLPPD